MHTRIIKTKTNLSESSKVTWPSVFAGKNLSRAGEKISTHRTSCLGEKFKFLSISKHSSLVNLSVVWLNVKSYQTNCPVKNINFRVDWFIRVRYTSLNHTAASDICGLLSPCFVNTFSSSGNTSSNNSNSVDIFWLLISDPQQLLLPFEAIITCSRKFQRGKNIPSRPKAFIMLMCYAYKYGQVVIQIISIITQDVARSHHIFYFDVLKSCGNISKVEDCHLQSFNRNYQRCWSSYLVLHGIVCSDQNNQDCKNYN